MKTDSQRAAQRAAAKTVSELITDYLETIEDVGDHGEHREALEALAADIQACGRLCDCGGCLESLSVSDGIHWLECDSCHGKQVGTIIGEPVG